MGLIGNNTRWFFILPSSQEAEERHIYDIAFGIKCLLSKGIDYSSISVLIDHASTSKIEAVFSKMQLQTPAKIYTTDQIDELLTGNTYKNAVVFITGHGSPKGLDTTNPIKPYSLYYRFQTTPNFKRVIIYLGQCYAGIFNQMPLSSHLGLKSEEMNKNCSIVAIGSTGLFSSISSPITVGNVRWSANIFLTYVFNWLMKPTDIDGDGCYSVMDSFKAATIYTNETLIDLKKKDNFESLLQQSQLATCIDKLKDATIPEDEKNNLLLEIQALEKMLQIRYINQEPWILNAHIAMSTSF